MTIDDIKTKVENQGATAEGRLSAEELNTIVEQVKTNRDTVAATGMSISGTLNLSRATTAGTMAAVYAALGNNQMRFYLVTDVDGGFKGGSVTAAGAVAKLFGKDSLGVSVGDICVIAKLNSLPVYRILPLNDAKAASGDFPGADGLETVWDKTQVNKIPGIETTANEARGFGASAYMPSLGESNMNNALQPGVYPWCTLGRPTGATGAFTCIVRKSYNADSGGYYTIEQTAYGRQDELGQVHKRIIFQKSDGSDTQYGEWICVSGGFGRTYRKEYYVIAQIVSLSEIYFPIPNAGPLDERCITNILGYVEFHADGKYMFPLCSLEYRIEGSLSPGTNINIKVIPSEYMANIISNSVKVYIRCVIDYLIQ